MVSFFPPEVAFLPVADDYLSFVVFFLLACGVAFQLPVVLTILVQLRILSVSILKKQRKIAYFVLFVFAEIVTPVTDPIVAPLVVLIPLVILYEGSILAAVRIEKRRLKNAEASQENILAGK
jgi:sec-independent protein translocase protein TatC